MDKIWFKPLVFSGVNYYKMDIIQLLSIEDTLTKSWLKWKILFRNFSREYYLTVVTNLNIVWYKATYMEHLVKLQPIADFICFARWAFHNQTIEDSLVSGPNSCRAPIEDQIHYTI